MRARASGGMTLVELLTASACLTLMLAGTAFIFGEAREAVSATQTQMDLNDTARSVSALLRSDLAKMMPHGLLVMSRAAGGADMPAPVLMFVAVGRFTSHTDTDPGTGRPVTSNMALIAYTLADDSQGDGRVLCRYVYLLTDGGSGAANLADLAAKALPDEPNRLDNSDVLSGSLANLQRMRIQPDQTHPESVAVDYIYPLLERIAEINPAPVRFDDESAGGVEQLWPYLASGCESMELAFCDGKPENPSDLPADTIEWVAPDSDGAFYRRYSDGLPLRWMGRGALFTVWRADPNPDWPGAIRVRLTFTDPARTARRVVELVIPARL